MIVTVGLYWLVGWLLLSDFSPEVEGIIVGGTTGEGHLLSLDERLGLISHTKARPEKMVGCTSPTQMARVRIEHVGDWGYIYIKEFLKLLVILVWIQFGFIARNRSTISGRWPLNFTIPGGQLTASRPSLEAG